MHQHTNRPGEDKQIKCWDLEVNKVIRQYHGHLSGIYCLGIHPLLDLMVTGGRDSTGRVWDMRTKQQIFALTGKFIFYFMITQPNKDSILYALVISQSINDLLTLRTFTNRLCSIDAPK